MILLIFKLQAAWRGAVVRQQLAAVRRAYQEVVEETELPGFSLNLTWKPPLLSLPRITKSGQPGLTVTTLEGAKTKSTNTANIIARKADHIRQTERKAGNVDLHTNEHGITKGLSEPGIDSKSTDSNDVEKEISIPIHTETSNTDSGSEKQDIPVQDSQIDRTGDSGQSEGGEVLSEKDKRPDNDNTPSGKPCEEEVCSLNQNTAVWDTLDASRFPASANSDEKRTSTFLIYLRANVKYYSRYQYPHP